MRYQFSDMSLNSNLKGQNSNRLGDGCKMTIGTSLINNSTAFPDIRKYLDCILQEKWL